MRTGTIRPLSGLLPKVFMKIMDQNYREKDSRDRPLAHFLVARALPLPRVPGCCESIEHSTCRNDRATEWKREEEPTRPSHIPAQKALDPRLR